MCVCVYTHVHQKLKPKDQVTFLEYKSISFKKFISSIIQSYPLVGKNYPLSRE